MKFLRAVALACLIVPVLAALTASPAAAGDPQGFTVNSFGYDTVGNDCTNPQSSITVAPDTDIAICFSFTADLDQLNTATGQLSFEVTNSNYPTETAIWTEPYTYQAGPTTYTRELTVPASDFFGTSSFRYFIRADDNNDYNFTNSYGTLNFIPPTLVKTVSADGSCGTTSEIAILPNTEVTYCYSMTNTSTTTDLTLYLIDDDQLGQIFSSIQVITPEATFVLTESAFIAETTTNVAVACTQWPDGLFDRRQGINTSMFDCDQPEPSGTATVTVEEPNPSLTLAATVGTTAGTCATETTVAVDLGTEVFFCYRATNDGNVPFDLHTVADTLNGALLTDKAHVLAPGETVTTIDLGATSSTTVTGDVTNSVTWTASGETPDPVMDTKLVAAATVTTSATATANVNANAPAPTPTPTADVIDEIAFTGNETGPLAILGITALFAGLILLAATRRRKN